MLAYGGSEKHYTTNETQYCSLLSITQLLLLLLLLSLMMMMMMMLCRSAVCRFTARNEHRYSPALFCYG